MTAVPPPPEPAAGITEQASSGEATGRGFGAWLRHLRVSSLVIGLVCILLAGMINQFSNSQGVIRRSGELNEKVQVSTTQSMQVLGLSGGNVAVDTESRDLVMTSGLFLAVRLELRSEGAARVGRLECEIETQRGRVAPTGVSGVAMPEPGFASVGTLLYEVDPDALSGATLVCTEGAFLSIRPVDIRVGLGLRGDALQTWRQESERAQVRYTTGFEKQVIS